MAPAPSALPGHRPSASQRRQTRRKFGVRKESRPKNQWRNSPSAQFCATRRRCLHGVGEAPNARALRLEHVQAGGGRAPRRGHHRPQRRRHRRARRAAPPTRRTAASSGPPPAARSRPTATPASISASATRKRYAGPDPLSAVTASRSVLVDAVDGADGAEDALGPRQVVVVGRRRRRRSPTRPGRRGPACSASPARRRRPSPAAAWIVAIDTPAAIDSTRVAPAADGGGDGDGHVGRLDGDHRGRARRDRGVDDDAGNCSRQLVAPRRERPRRRRASPGRRRRRAARRAAPRPCSRRRR